MTEFLKSLGMLPSLICLLRSASADSYDWISPLDWDPLARIEGKQVPHFSSAPSSTDLARNLLGELKYTTLNQMRTAGLE